jgi:hypothetical protein
VNSRIDRRRHRVSGLFPALATTIAVPLVAALLAACTGGSGGTGPSTSPSTQSHRSTPTSSGPSGPDACALITSAQVGHALKAKVASAKSTTRGGAPVCTWANAAGRPLATLELSTNIDQMLLQNLANNGAYQPRGLHTMTVFAPRPPRMVIRAGSYAALVTLQPAWYQRYLPNGQTNPRTIPRSTTTPPLLAIEGVILKNS